MKIIELKDKHPLIYKRILEINKEQYNHLDIDNKIIFTAIHWRKTDEGYDIWDCADDFNYQPFYDFHKLQNPENIKGDYYNTTNLNGKELTESKEKALSQTQYLLYKLSINYLKTDISAWILYNDSAMGSNVPITSIRRTLNTLEKQHKIECTGQRIGNLGKKEFTYKLIL